MSQKTLSENWLEFWQVVYSNVRNVKLGYLPVDHEPAVTIHVQIKYCGKSDVECSSFDEVNQF